MKKVLAILTFAVVLPLTAYANPTQTGVTGLINVPTADTLDAGNICVGTWLNFSKNDGRESAIAPVALTLGVGSFWEVYGTYPNLLFNGKEDASGRGTADIGTKLRFWGARNSPLKLAVDLFLQRQVSNDLKLDGTTSGGSRLIASYKLEKLGVHAYGGYLMSGSASGKNFDNEFLFGTGVEMAPSQRMRVTAELTGNTSRESALDNPIEATIGFQYYMSPHITVNLAGGFGFTAASPDWRTTIGFTTCQGVGTYVKPVPRLGRGGDTQPKKADVIKPAKIVPISSLLLKTAPPQALSKLEVPVEADREEIVIKPYGQVTIAPAAATAKAVTQKTAEEVALSAGGEDVNLRLTPKAAAEEDKSAMEYTLNRMQGVTPLYGVDVKGEKVEVANVKTEKIPEAMKVYRKFRFPDVSFDFDQWSVSTEGKKLLSEVAEQIRNDKKWIYLRIDGHTDNIGSVTYNLDLSLKRAISVASYLVAHEGIDASRLFLKGLGKSKPIADNSNAEGRKQNRRSEILFLVAKDGQ